jgi:hypothetical protein
VPDLTPRESIVLPEFYRSGRTVQIEDRLATAPNRVDVGRSMIVRINHNPQPAQSENRRHKSILAGFLSAWVQSQLDASGLKNVASGARIPPVILLNTGQSVCAAAFSVSDLESNRLAGI